MANPFATRAAINQTMPTMATNNPKAIQTPVSNPDPVSTVESALQRSGGDAKAAFYSMAKEQGKDPEQGLEQIRSMGDMKTIAQKMMRADPKIGRLLSLFSMVK